MPDVINLEPSTCELLFLLFKENEYNRAITEDNHGIPVFDTRTGDIVYIDDLSGVSERPPSPSRLTIIAEIDRLDDLLFVRDELEENWELPQNIQVSEPRRYVEIPHITHANEHGWLDDWAGSPQGPHIGEALERLGAPHGSGYEEFKDTKVRDEIIEWLAITGATRDISYQYEHDWLTY